MSSEEQRTESAADVDETADVEHVDDERSADTAEDGSGEAESNADGQQDAEKAARNETLKRRLVFGSAALAAASIIAAAVFGVLWWIAASDDDADLAQTREEIVRVGSSAVQAFTELDYTKPDEYFDRSAAAATGELAEQINAGREANKKAMVEAKTTASTKVLDLAVAELNEHEGKASFLAAIQVEVKQGEQSSVKAMRVEVQMTRVEEDGEQTWKVSGISQVPVVGAAQ
ncbi:Mce-associated membrane protein [Amycolatopsis marina]|uniref:Mce-associated membrane protein n=1 Tax=Amycolatopsis marina TaxID=490629 RepID=A0A1I1A089_9PSEU|nr:hypothetical protein [Amycolatopsis marina]SFB30766.1 Mce-associated membrane protein [Amycolatopsis marina]